MTDLPAYSQLIASSPAMAARYQTYGDAATAAADAAGIPSDIFLAAITQESGWNPKAINPNSGAIGIAQFMPSTAYNAGYGIAPFDPTDPYASLKAAAQYMRAMFDRTGNWNAALASYNGGIGGAASPTAQKYAATILANSGVDPATIGLGASTNSLGQTADQKVIADSSIVQKLKDVFGFLGSSAIVFTVGLMIVVLSLALLFRSSEISKGISKIPLPAA